MGDIMGDLSSRRGKPQGMETQGHYQVIKAAGPAGRDADLRLDAQVDHLRPRHLPHGVRPLRGGPGADPGEDRRRSRQGTSRKRPRSRRVQRATSSTSASSADHVGERVRSCRAGSYQKRSSGKIRFLVLRDGTGLPAVRRLRQGRVRRGCSSACDRVPLESSVAVRGTVRKDDRAPGGFELALDDARRSSTRPPSTRSSPRSTASSSCSTTGTSTCARARRTPCCGSATRSCRPAATSSTSATSCSSTRRSSRPAACEGTTTLFETDYFDDKAYLAQSGQLYLEPACMAFGRVYCFGPDVPRREVARRGGT